MSHFAYAAVVLGVIAAPASAATTTYTDLASFDAALGFASSVQETFTGNVVTSPLISSITGSVELTNDRAQQIAGGNALPADQQFTTFNFSAPLYAIAFTVASLGSSESSTVLLDAVPSGTLTDQPGSGRDFFGFISTTLFSSITFLDETFPNVNTQFNIDDMRLVAPIPLPAALPLMLAGLGALAFLGRRKA